VSLRGLLRAWLAMATVWSLAAALVVGIEHQVLRLEANDPQVQLAEDLASRLTGGADPKSALPPASVDIAHSLAPFLAIYDAAGAPVASTGMLDGAPPKLPGGVLVFARREGGHRLSWQPRKGVRQALVIVLVRGGQGGFAVAGRSLREVEQRKLQVLHLALLLWAGGLLACLLAALLVRERIR
jgi:hypothetical protein